MADHKFDLPVRLSRFLGSLVLLPQDVLRYKYWRQEHEWMSSPVYIWCVVFSCALDGVYGICLWYVRRNEQGLNKREGLKMG